uniref:Uncharacterized protein n=1 Tax=Anguilla anguilla TaxID=7936 RepID=A0A0E9UV01_ANGAN
MTYQLLCCTMQSPPAAFYYTTQLFSVLFKLPINACVPINSLSPQKYVYFCIVLCVS